MHRTARIESEVECASRMVLSIGNAIPQGLKPAFHEAFSARLKSCPDTDLRNML